MRPPRIGEFVQQFGGAYLSTEGALWRTLKLLLAKPGELTRQYLAGRRKHYVLPLRLYLTISLLSLLMLRTMTSASTDSSGPLQLDVKTDEVNLVAIDDRLVVALKNGQFICKGLPDWTCKRLQRRLVADPEALKDQMGQLGERFVANLGAALFLMLPAFALLLRLCYYNRRLRYTEHLVFALHLHAFWFIALMLAVPGLPWVSALAWLAVPLYAALALKRVYGGRWWPLLLRSAVVSLAYLWVLGFALLLVLGWSLVF